MEIPGRGWVGKEENVRLERIGRYTVSTFFRLGLEGWLMMPADRRISNHKCRTAFLCGVLCCCVVVLSVNVQAGEVEPAAKPLASLKQKSIQSLSKEPAPSAAEIAKVIRDLDSDLFAEREGAVVRLLSMGQPVVSALANAAESGSAEASWRAIFVLKEMALRLNFAELEAAERSLHHLAVSSNGIARQRASKVIANLAEKRGERAVEAITKLGGKMVVQGYLRLDGDWKGGDAALGYVPRLTAMERILIEPTAGISTDAVKQLRAKMPDVNIVQFGKAFLGVGGEFDLNGMIVTSVVPDSAAAKAGIEPNDIIVRIDGQKIADFDALVELIAKKKSGDEVTLQYYKHANGNILTRKAKLTARPILP